MLGADPRDPRIVEILNEIGANDNYRHTVARSLLPVDEPFVQQYVQATSSPLHKFKLQVESVFQIESAKDKDFKGFANHKLLWYGTSPENVYSTLRDGFSLNSEDGSFGNKALYFTDCATKAANYTSADGGKFSGAADTGDVSPGFDQTGYLFLAEVSLGRGNEYSEANPNARLLLNGADSVYGRGSYRPDGEYVMRNTEPKVILPMGDLKQFEDLPLKHNEWVIYAQKQARLRYLVKVRIV